MATHVREWFRENQTLIYFLAAQALAVIIYTVRLDGRVTTLETRGSPHLAVIDNRLTVLESTTEDNKASIDRIINVMTRQLNSKGNGK
jgi:hypothetical protein